MLQNRIAKSQPVSIKLWQSKFEHFLLITAQKLNITSIVGVTSNWLVIINLLILLLVEFIKYLSEFFGIILFKKI